MSKRLLIGAIAAAVLAVGAFAAITAIVIVDEGGGTRVVRLAPSPAPGRSLPPLWRGRRGRPFGPGLGPRGDFRRCLEQHGLGRPNRTTPPRLETRRKALEACRATLPRR